MCSSDPSRWRIFADIGLVNDSALDCRSTCIAFCSVDSHGLLRKESLERVAHAPLGDKPKTVSFDHKQRPLLRLAEPAGMLDDGLKDRRVVSRRLSGGAKYGLQGRFAWRQLVDVFRHGSLALWRQTRATVPEWAQLEIGRAHV